MKLHLTCAALALGACATTPTDAPESSDEGENAAIVQEQFGWQRIGDCATNLGVSPDDTIWFIGCDAAADGVVWYSRIDDSDPFGGFRQWVPSATARARWINVDDGGDPTITTSTVERFRTGASDAGFPGDNWGTRLGHPTSRGPFAEVLHHHDEPYLLFQSNNTDRFSPTVHHFYALTMSRDGSGDGIALQWSAADVGPGGMTDWKTITSATGATMRGQQIALFTPMNAERSEFKRKNVWTVTAGGVVTEYDDTLFSKTRVRPSPPSPILSLTDHFALTADGVYQWDDAANGAWTPYVGCGAECVHLGSTTPHGTIIQIAHAGPTNIKQRNGRFKVFESGLWAIDDAGFIYKAGIGTEIR
jgi:hypothetical protein